MLAVLRVREARALHVCDSAAVTTRRGTNLCRTKSAILSRYVNVTDERGRRRRRRRREEERERKREGRRKEGREREARRYVQG